MELNLFLLVNTSKGKLIVLYSYMDMEIVLFIFTVHREINYFIKKKKERSFSMPKGTEIDAQVLQICFCPFGSMDFFLILITHGPRRYFIKKKKAEVLKLKADFRKPSGGSCGV